jgi:hypothetical protein
LTSAARLFLGDDAALGVIAREVARQTRARAEANVAAIIAAALVGSASR